MTRIGNLAHHDLLQFQIQATLSRISKTQIQVASGKVAEKFSGIAMQSSLLVNLKNSLDRTDQFLTNIVIVEDRLTFMENDASQLYDIAVQFNVLLVQGLSGENASQQGLDILSQGLLEEAAALLNDQVDGRFLFAGTATDTAPVDITDPTFAAGPPGAYPGSVDLSYARGNSTRLSVRADENFTLTYGVTADESGFEKLLRALNLARTATLGPPMDRDRLNEAHRLVNEALDEISPIISRIGASRTSLANVKAKHLDFKLIAKEEISGIENLDIAEAITRLMQDETALEASFMMIARLTGLSLTRFL